VNSSLVRVPAEFNLELPRVLGHLIAEHLPTRAVKPWKNTLNGWHDYWHRRQKEKDDSSNTLIMPDAIWPLEAVFNTLPSKRTYGRGELIFWELKLLGNSADHTFFLEMILPAMEEAGYTADARWNRHNTLWGHFDIDAIYVARGRQWEPLVENGELNLTYNALPSQWSDETEEETKQNSIPYRHLHWLTPFDFATPAEAFLKMPMLLDAPEVAMPKASEVQKQRPFLVDILHALLERLEHILSHQHKGPVNIWNMLDESAENHLRAALVQSEKVALRFHNLKPIPEYMPGRLIGMQGFAPIPPILIPYLDLAAILHVGEYTQFGCGTFTLT
jgi:hypothetical protein